MSYATFHQVGDLIMMSIPDDVVEALNIQPGDGGELEIKDGAIVVKVIKSAANQPAE